MQKRYISAASMIAALVLVGGGCANKTAAVPQAAAPAPAPVVQQAPAPVAVVPGKTGFDFPIQSSLSLAAGNYVLAPSKESVASGAEGTYIYYAAKLVKSGEAESVIKTLPGETVTIPNSLIIPIPAGRKAAVGDMVLTWWQSGSGMQRAIVVGGTPTEPQVVYLDQDSTTPETLKPDTFDILYSDNQVGNAIACLDGGSYKRFQSLSADTEGKTLVMGWAGKVSVVSSADCKVLHHDAKVKVGDTVKVPVFATYKDATVTKIDAKTGRIYAKYSFAGSEEEKAFSFGEVAKSF